MSWECAGELIPAYAGNTELGHVTHRRRAVHPRAYAGNTVVEVSQALIGTVHPRIRGEYHSPRASITRWRGSSPHTRGIQHDAADGGAVCRFIPAYAGNTTDRRCSRGCRTVHPRIRGEYDCSALPPAAASGSSPHTRGIRARVRDPRRRSRFIPAYAGNTHRDLYRPPAATVHPRIRGEYPARRPDFSSRCGSSPHTRGIQSH